jgi:LPXTG-motif cell wall-anchored protein
MIRRLSAVLLVAVLALFGLTASASAGERDYDWDKQCRSSYEYGHCKPNYPPKPPKPDKCDKHHGWCDKDRTPPPTTPTAKGPLAKTGADNVAVVAAAGVGLVVLGGAAVAASRRRRGEA